VGRVTTPTRALVLDSGAVIGWARGDVRVRSALREAINRGVPVTAPVVVLAETLRGGPRDAPVNRVVKAIGIEPTSPETGRLAGTLLGRTGGRNAADALVAAEAASKPARCELLTSDPDDLTTLLVDAPHVRITPV
jgi:predicted nucleic acid-binding protein